ncbi:MAG: trypsin-like peptidase domain-containing protein [Phycisphaerae bacterium]
MLARILICTLLTLNLGQSAVAGPDSNEEAYARRHTPVVQVVEKCRDAVVNISTTRIVRSQQLGPRTIEDLFLNRPRTRNQRIESIGSGFIIHETGYIVTNAHVVAQAADMRVVFADQREFEARPIAIDRQHDLAVIKIDAPQSLPAIRLGSSDDLMIGEPAIAIGNPLGLHHTVTSGIVSAVNRDLEISGELELTELIQTDAPINPGNSGGPLLNINAELIGINSAIRGDAQSIGFAIPVNRLWEMLPKMLDIERSQRVFFGATVLGRSARVQEVRAESPAARAGLRIGDTLTALNGQTLRDSIDYYVKLLALSPGANVQVQLQRDGKSLTLNIPLEIAPPPEGDVLARKIMGLNLIQVPERLLQQHGVPSFAKLMVESVERRSPAERVGIREGDFLVAVDQIPVTTLEKLGLVLERVSSGQTVSLEGLRWRADPPFQWTTRIRARE